MINKITLFTIILLIIPLTSSAELTVEQLEKNNILISELESSNATFKLKITNNENRDDEFQIYSLVSIRMYPKEFFTIKKGETIILDVTAEPYKNILEEKKGVYAFEYQIKGKNTGFFKDSLAIRIFDIKDIIETSVNNIIFGAETAKITITNKEKVPINDLTIVAKSKFFEFSQIINLANEETKTFDIPITLQKPIPAGEYKVEIRYEINDKKSSKTTNLQYLEESGLSTTETEKGFIIKKVTTTKTNEGNIPATSIITSRKNIITRLFTIYSDKPTSSIRSGIFVDYTWEKELGVGESYTLTVTTNYTFPLIIILLIISVGILVKFFATGKVTIKKRVAFVRTKGGEFALKVALRVKAHKNVSGLIVTDRIPGHAKVFNKFGIQPHRIDESTRRLEWDVSRLNTGEERIFTYVIYSKINIIGSFELPAASVSFECNGQKDHVFSNKTYFAAETTEN
jgi:hypothetical protein